MYSGPPEIAIVGAGIGGLTAAIGLAQQGAKVDVFEKAPHLTESGAGIWVPPNAMQILDWLGAAADVRRAGMEIKCAELHDYRSGRLQIVPTRNSAGLATVAILRQSLQQVLARHAAAAAIHFGHQLVGSAQAGACAELQFANSVTHRAKVVLAADGIHSVMRRLLFPQVKLRYSGQTSWRAVVRFEIPSSSLQKSFEIWAPGVRFGYSAVASELVYWYATADLPEGHTERVEQTKDRLLRLARAFPPPVPDLILVTPAETIIRTDLWDLPGLKSWQHGCVMLFGDAAHAATPNLGQGGAQAVEDAWTLARVFRAETDPSRAFSDFEHSRVKRALSIVRSARLLGTIAHFGGSRRLLRNVVVRLIPPAFTNWQMKALLDSPLGPRSEAVAGTRSED